MISSGKAVALAVVALALAGCGSAGKTPMASDVPGAAVQVYAAGSLREVFTAIASEHEARTDQKIALTFGASGLLRERIEKGEPAQVFAAADEFARALLAPPAQAVFIRSGFAAP